MGPGIGGGSGGGGGGVVILNLQSFFAANKPCPQSDNEFKSISLAQSLYRAAVC